MLDPLAVSTAGVSPAGSAVDLSPSDSPRPARLPRLTALFLLVFHGVRWILVLGSTLLAFVVVTAILGAWVAPVSSRVLLGLGLVLAIPSLLLMFLRHRLGRRLGRRLRLGGRWFVVGCQLALVFAVGLGFSDSTGRALRRRGDWFLGAAQGWLPRRLRGALREGASWLERFDTPPELAAPAKAMVGTRLPALPHLPIAPPKKGIVGAPGVPVTPRSLAALWFHPVGPRSGGRRVLPPNASCRFGAYRAHVNKKECELGHCGVDLFGPLGTPVYASTAGVVLRAERDAARGGRAGRYVILTHRKGRVRSYYIHLDQLTPGLKKGARIGAGQRLGTIGRTGMKRSAAHLHFAVQLRRRRGWRYIDPEPLLWTWRLPGGFGRLSTRREPMSPSHQREWRLRPSAPILRVDDPRAATLRAHPTQEDHA